MPSADSTPAAATIFWAAAPPRRKRASLMVLTPFCLVTMSVCSDPITERISPTSAGGTFSDRKAAARCWATASNASAVMSMPACTGCMARPRYSAGPPSACTKNWTWRFRSQAMSVVAKNGANAGSARTRL